jgi:hypothetical protein
VKLASIRCKWKCKIRDGGHMPEVDVEQRSFGHT